MPYIEINNDWKAGEIVNLYYEDYGQGRPIVLIHGWPLDHTMWDYQVAEFVAQGYRCVAYDRRGFGKSSRPWNGYDYDTLADDLKRVMEKLDLKDVILIGFSMGGGEVVRYFGRHGGERVSQAILLGSVTPFMLKTENNADGIDKGIFDEMAEEINEDRIDFLESFGKEFYGVTLVSHPVSSAHLGHDKSIASFASLRATLECAKSFSQTDFRPDMATVKVPTLIIHGTADKTVPIALSARRSVDMIPGAKLIEYENEPHGFFFTAKDKLGKDILNFIKPEKKGQEKEEEIATANV